MQITFAKVTNGGSGYTSATVSVLAVTGSGAAAANAFRSLVASIIGIQMSILWLRLWRRYDRDDQPATGVRRHGNRASWPAGFAEPRDYHRLPCRRWHSPRPAASPAQSNWTGAPITVPAGTSIDWVGSSGGWRAARFTQSDYVSPNGDGSLTLRTQSGDISLHPAGTGVVRLLSDAESTGAVELIGRGSPLNVVSAPAGSTFRNLNGGVGATFWVKQSGSGSTNWVAVA